MNKKSKGTTLIEIMVSILLISIVMVFLFNILINMKEEYNLSSQRSEDSLNRSSFTRIIQNDFMKHKLNKLTNCNEGKLCIEFTLSGNIIKKLIVNDKSIIYDGEIWELTAGKYDVKKTIFNYYVAETNPTKLNQPNVVNYHSLKIIVPVEYDVFSSKKLDLEITNIESGVLQLNCTTFGNYLFSKGVNGSNVYCYNQ